MRIGVMTIKTMLVAALLVLCGCDMIPRVRAYQARATAKCEEHHTPEQCKALAYPACQPGNFGGMQCQ
jgi:hypothetical protein